MQVDIKNKWPISVADACAAFLVAGTRLQGSGAGDAKNVRGLGRERPPPHLSRLLASYFLLLVRRGILLIFVHYQNINLRGQLIDNF